MLLCRATAPHEFVGGCGALQPLAGPGSLAVSAVGGLAGDNLQSP